MSQSTKDLAKQTAATVAATNRRWCSSHQGFFPEEGGMWKGARWLCQGCKQRAEQGHKNRGKA